MMLADGELLGRYAKGHDETAFAELVSRHLPMVYCAALRQVGSDSHLAEDVCQSVFSDLSRKARQLAGRDSIAGWLYTSARFAASKTVRLEVRRRTREEAVSAMNTDTSNVVWADLRDFLDAAMNELGEKDREAIVLRYFEARDLAVVGAAMGTTGNAARMRLDRALEKLRRVLEKRGVTATSAALASALGGAVAEAVPASLVSMVAAGAITTAPATGGGLFIMAGVAAVAASFAVIFLNQSLSVTTDSLATAPMKGRLADTPGHSSATELHMPKGDPFLLQKMAQRHEAQVRAHRATTNDWFSQQMRDEPGVKKFGARLQTIVAPGDTLVCGGWTVATGLRKLFMITPVMGTNGSDKVDIEVRVITAPDTMFDSTELRGFRTAENDVAVSQQMPTEQANQLVNTSNIVVDARPRIRTSLGCEADLETGGKPEGQSGYEAFKVDVNPTRATDGASINLDLATFYIEPDYWFNSPHAQ